MSSAKPKQQPIEAVAERLKIGRYKKHIFFCAGPSCCKAEDGEKVWNYLKSRTKELSEAGIDVYRTRTTCLRICQDGPIALVYPEGTWYRNVDEKNCEEIITQHLINGKEVTQCAFARNALASE